MSKGALVFLTGNVLAAAAVCLSGCAGIEHQSWVNPTTVADYPVARMAKTQKAMQPEGCSSSLDDTAINLDCFHFPEDASNVDSSNTAYAKVVNNIKPDDARTVRNRLAWILFNKSDAVCTSEMGRLTAHEAMVNLGFDAASTLFSTSSSIVAGKIAKSILSGFAGSSTALRTHFDADVYRNAISSTITHAIISDRGKQRIVISNLLKSSVSDYTVDEMISDLNRYHQTCSVFMLFNL